MKLPIFIFAAILMMTYGTRAAPSSVDDASMIGDDLIFEREQPEVTDMAIETEEPEIEETDAEDDTNDVLEDDVGDGESGDDDDDDDDDDIVLVHDAFNTTDIGCHKCHKKKKISRETTVDKSFKVTCSTRCTGISSISSIYFNKSYDRSYRFSCGVPIRRPARCRWSRYMNRYDGLLNFNCGRNKYIGGMRSRYSRCKKDRVWSFKCCHQRRMKLSCCFKTYWTNDYDGSQNFHVPVGYVLVGIHSNYCYARHDRRFAYTVCRKSYHDEQ